MINIRTVQPSDLYFINHVYNQTVNLRFVTADSFPQSNLKRLENYLFKDLLQFPIYIFYVGNKRIGWGSINLFYNREAYQKVGEVSIYLEKSNIGKGYSKECLSLLEDEAKKLGFKTLLAYIFNKNIASLELFKKQGYTKSAMFEEIAKFKDYSTQDLVILRKEFT